MKIIHGTWIPGKDEFIQTGAFYLWVETTDPTEKRKSAQAIHPHQLLSQALEAFLGSELGVNPGCPLDRLIAPKYFLLPSNGQAPLPSIELARYLEQTIPEIFEWQYWQVDCFEVKTWVKTGQYASQPVTDIIKLLNELHFIALHNLADMQLGADLLFWYHYTQTLKPVLLKDQYIPAMRYREVAAAKGSAESSKSKTRTKTQPGFEIYPAWEIVSEQYETELKRFVDYMPLACVAGFTDCLDQPSFYDRETLLRHFSEHLLTEIVSNIYLPASFDKKIAGTLIADCLEAKHGLHYAQNTNGELYQQWRTWRDRIHQSQTSVPFHLCFQLQDPPQPEDAWQLQFLVAPKQDPSLQISLLDYWRLKPNRQQELQKHFGDSFEQHLLLNLGYAARIYPQLWQGLETDQPIGIPLEVTAALDFLQESAWVLENAGYKVIVPAWWTPKGRQRAKIKLRAKGKSASSANDKSKSYFSHERLVQYKYDLAIGDQKISEEEWLELVQAKSPLVQFRGQWMHLDQDKMQQMLEFWKTQQAENPDMSLLDFMRMTAEGGEDVEVDFNRDKTLAQMLKQLQDKSKLDAIADPKTLQGTLREYHKNEESPGFTTWNSSV